MIDSQPSRTTPKHFCCAGCGYDLTGLELSGDCPECGFNIAASVTSSEELRKPVDKIPHLKATVALLVIATLTGAPALILFAGSEHFLQYGIPKSAPQDMARRVLMVTPWLLVIGSFLPLLTILSIPSGTGGPTFRRRRAALVVALLLLGGIGVALYAYGPILRWLELLDSLGARGWPEVFLAPPITACACALGLSTAAKLIGQTMPGWKRLGAARQTAAPLIGAIIVIAVLRPLVLEATLDGLLLFTAKTILIGAEFLLAIGALYLLVNRIWLASRLIHALRFTKSRMETP